MLRRSSASLSLIFALAASHVTGCAPAGETTVSSGAGGSTIGSGGKPGTGGGGGKAGSGGVATGTGGIATGTGGVATGTGGIATGTGGIATGTGGSPGGTGGNGAGGRACPAGTDVIADFEDGTTNLIKQNGMSGWWYVYSDTLPGTQEPPANATGYVAAKQLPASEQTSCNKWAYYSKATGHTDWVGTGATGAPNGSTAKTPVNVSAFSGITFRIKPATSTPIWFEVLTKETQPSEGSGTASDDKIDKHNNRGVLLDKLPLNAWTTVNVPFAIMGPRWLPSACTATSPICEAPQFVATSFLGFQFSVYPAFTTAGAYDFWVDDVKFLSGNAGLATLSQSGNGLPFPQDATMGSCTKPAGASGKFLVDAYNQWKSVFVTSSGAPTGALRVKRPENSDDSVSEGIAYGMLIAANMGDKATFDGLWTYWKAYPAVGTGNTALMHWQINSSGGKIGDGSATDADEDAAFALLVAGKQWGQTYTDAGKAMVGQIWTSDIDANKWVKGGNKFGGRDVTNPSYFAPAFYRVFKTVDSGHDWDGVIANVYAALATTSISGSNGLVPAWCTGNGTTGCTSPGSNGLYQQDTLYQYDAHRTPWRIGLDYCWNGSTASAAKTYVDKTSAFFSGQAAGGIGKLADIYSSNGSSASGSKNNSMSIIGTAAVGAMANTTYGPFLKRAYDFTRDGLYAPPSIKNTPVRPWYTYYNATVGLLTLMTMSGNFAKP